ncbi:MAG: hypothetical protein IJ572_05135 [Bacilli bacterium]|nr:hypothetical protein [Bacilli bacterium]
MTINTQMKILNTKNYYQYLKENSNWFKELSRDDNNIYKFIEFTKDKYKLRATDKLSNAIDSIDLISNVLSVLK